MYHRVQIERLSVGSVFKILYIGFLVPFLGLLLIVSLASAVGCLVGFPVEVNGKPQTGINGALASALAGVIGSVLLPLMLMPSLMIMSMVITFGLWIYSKFRPLTLDYVPAPNEENRGLLAESEAAVPVL
jgi:hypothetical protein